MKFTAIIFILSLTAFFAEVSVLQLIQCNVEGTQKMDKCGVCNMKNQKDVCKTKNKKNNDGCNKNSFCFSCPLCSSFVANKLNQQQTVQLIFKKIYCLYSDDFTSDYIPFTWKPPNTFFSQTD